MSSARDDFTMDDRLLAAEHAAAVALCFATLSLGDGSESGRQRAADEVKRMMIALRGVCSDTRDNPGFDRALAAIVGRYLTLIGST